MSANRCRRLAPMSSSASATSNITAVWPTTWRHHSLPERVHCHHGAEPHCVIAHIVPWNYPLQMTMRSMAPALVMGNAIVLKPAEDTSLTALARLSEEAGFPPLGNPNKYDRVTPYAGPCRETASD